MNVSSGFFSIRMETFLKASFWSLSHILALVTALPSFPARGEMFLQNIIDTVGSSTVILGRAFLYSLLQMVSPIETSLTPDSTTMSPGSTDCTSLNTGPSYACRRVTRRFSSPFSFMQTRESLVLTLPLITLPTARRPRKSEYDRSLTSIWKGSSSSYSGAGT